MYLQHGVLREQRFGQNVVIGHGETFESGLSFYCIELMAQQGVVSFYLIRVRSNWFGV